MTDLPNHDQPKPVSDIGPDQNAPVSPPSFPQEPESVTASDPGQSTFPDRQPSFGEDVSSQETVIKTPPWAPAAPLDKLNEEGKTPDEKFPLPAQETQFLPEEDIDLSGSSSLSEKQPSSFPVETPSAIESAPLKVEEASEEPPSEANSSLPEAPSESAVSPGLESPPSGEVAPLIPGQPEIFHPEKKSSSGLVKKILFLLLILLILGGLAFGIYRFVLPLLKKNQAVSLTYWGLWEPDNVLREILSEWEKEHPDIKISYEQQSPKEYRERLQSALARGEGPDLFRLHNTWLPMFKAELEAVPNTVIDSAGFEQAYYPAAVSSLRSGSAYLAIPLEIDTLALFYNQDIFTAAGATPPETWDDLRTLASQLTLYNEEGRIQRAGVALGTTGNIWHWSDILGLMMLQNGADLSNPTGSLAEDPLAFYTLFSKTDRVWDETLPDSIIAFATGKAAMVFGFSWDVFEIQQINPQLNFKVVAVPQLPETDVTWASFWVEGVSKKSANKEAAWEFLKFLSSREMMEKLYQAESRVRLFGEPYSRVEMSSLLQADPVVAPFINQAPKARTWYLCSRTFDNGINDRMIKYFEDAVNAVNAGQSPQSALSTAASGVSQVLGQYGLTSYSPR